MLMNIRLQTITGLLCVAILLIATLLPTGSVQAYKAFPQDPNYPKLPSTGTFLYIFYDHLNSMLGLTDSGTPTIRAVNQWDVASRYTLIDVESGGPINKTRNTIRAIDFNAGYTTCGINLNQLGFGVRGATCPLEVNIFLNANSVYSWNTSGDMSTFNYPPCSCNHYHVDYMTIVLHELGHLWDLDHPLVASAAGDVMNFNNTTKQVLLDDDKNGATQFYGADTGWETNLTDSRDPGYPLKQAMGRTDLVAMNYTVQSPQLRAVPAELGITPHSGSRYLKLYGNAIGIPNYPYAYLYMKLFTGDDDEKGSNPFHLTVTNGMTLSWYQYSSAQRTMSVDILFSDGTTLRDSGLNDQNGIRVHPAYRSAYPTGSWYFIQVNLSPLAGKRVKDIMVAYDNGGNGQLGTFRGYIDDLHFEY